MSTPAHYRETLEQRATLYTSIRNFFNARGVLEVETPLLCSHTVTDRYIDSFSAGTRYLQTSPEYAMKRLLARGSGPIFQICKAFRQDEVGHQHNPEFTLLEWYRPGFTHRDLMEELTDLFLHVGFSLPIQSLTYQEVFQTYLNIDPFTCDTGTLKELLPTMDSAALDRDTCLQLAFSQFIEPQLKGITFIALYPASQAALSKISKDNPEVSERFEVFIDGVEIANGFHELTDATEQQQRFEQDQAYRQQHGKKIPKIDSYLLDALHSGLPNTSGVAVGIDRLLMCLHNKKNIHDVLTFSWKKS